MKNAIRCTRADLRSFEFLETLDFKHHYYIYLIHDDDEFYIGSTSSSIWKRMTEHVNNSKSAAHELMGRNPKILFKRYVIEKTNSLEDFVRGRYKKEQAYIDKFKLFGFKLLNASKAYDETGGRYKTFCNHCACFVSDKHNTSKSHIRRVQLSETYEREYNFMPAIN